jgi:predicted ArsR family transcriptional regulator
MVRRSKVKRDRSREGSMLAAVVADAFAARAVLRRGPVTVAGLAAEVELPLRKAYRLLAALQAAGLPVEELPGTARPPGGGRAARLYRLRERGAGLAP